jgi:Lipase (class 3)
MTNISITLIGSNLAQSWSEMSVNGRADLRAALLTLLALLLCQIPVPTQGKEEDLNKENVPSIHRQTAYLMYAYAAFCAHPNPARLKEWDCFWCHRLNWVNNVTVQHITEDDGTAGIFGYIGTTVDTEDGTGEAVSRESGSRGGRPLVIVSFRGTASLDNWETDLELWENVFPECPGGCAVHHGFFAAWLRVREQVIATVQKLVSSLHATTGVRPKVLTTGHSLGASMSAICSVELVRAGLQKHADIEMVNFGQTRVGNAAFASYAKKLVPSRFRVVNMRDIVPHYPPEVSITRVGGAGTTGVFFSCLTTLRV